MRTEVSRKLVNVICTLLLLVKSLCADQYHEVDHKCQVDEFPCFRDCCVKEETFCDASKEEERCRFCHTIEFKCNTDSVPPECLLYCHKRTSAAEVDSDKDKCHCETKGELVVLVVFLVVSVCVSIIFAFLYCKSKRSTPRHEIKGSETGSTAMEKMEMACEDDQNVHKCLLDQPQDRDRDEEAESEDLQFVASNFDSKDPSRCSTPAAPLDELAQGGTRPGAPAGPETIQSANPTCAQTANPTSAQTANPTNVQTANPTNVQPSDNTADSTQSHYVPTGTTSNGGGASLLYANDIAESSSPAATHRGRQIVSPSGNETSDKRLHFATSTRNPSQHYEADQLEN